MYLRKILLINVILAKFDNLYIMAKILYNITGANTHIVYNKENLDIENVDKATKILYKYKFKSNKNFKRVKASG